jgi:hypothetical protein
MAGGPLIPWFRLWRKESAAGGEYFVGRVAGLRVVILQRRDNDPDVASDHDFVAFVAEPDNVHQPRPAPPPRRPAQMAMNGVDPPQRPPDPIPSAPSPRRPTDRGGGPKIHRIDDDAVPF